MILKPSQNHFCSKFQGTPTLASEGATQNSLLECKLGLYSFPPNNQGFSLFSGLLVCKMRPGTGRTLSPDESVWNCPGAWLLLVTCSADQAWLSIGCKIESVTTSSLADFRRHSTPRGGVTAGKNRAHYYPHYLFLTQHSKVCEGKEYNSLCISILQYLLQARASAC